MKQNTNALRQELRQHRRNIPPAQRIAAADGLAQQLLTLPFLPPNGFVAGYWACDGEIALHIWQLNLPKSLTYCLPVLVEDILCFAPWQPRAPLRNNRYGIPEPDIPTEALIAAQDMALVVMPLTGFDHLGQRLGMGGGWYDRSFAFRQHHPAPPHLVGAAFALQQTDSNLPAQPWDVSMDAVCTETETLLFSTHL